MALYSQMNKCAFKAIFFIITVIEIWLLSGITYGWASIAYVFEREGFFQYVCNSKETDRNISSFNASSSQSGPTAFHFAIGSCSLQRKSFNLVFAISLLFLCSAKFPIGIFVDKFGPRAGQIVGG